MREKERKRERKGLRGHPFRVLPTVCVSLSLLNGFTALRLWQHINWRRETYKIKRKARERKRQLAKKKTITKHEHDERVEMVKKARQMRKKFVGKVKGKATHNTSE